MLASADCYVGIQGDSIDSNGWVDITTDSLRKCSLFSPTTTNYCRVLRDGIAQTTIPHYRALVELAHFLQSFYLYAIAMGETNHTKTRKANVRLVLVSKLLDFQVGAHEYLLAHNKTLYMWTPTLPHKMEEREEQTGILLS